MISGDFYPQAYSLNGDEIILTDDILTLSGTVQESMAPYYIGYVNFDNMPTHWKMHTISIDSNTIVVDDIVENYGWGFAYHWNDMDGSGIALMRPAFIIESNGTKTDLYGGYSHHFVNHAIMASANFSNAYRICFTYIAMPTAWIKEDDSSIGSMWAGHYNELRTANIETTYEQLHDFLDNNGTFTLTNLYYDTRNNTVTVSKSDFGEDTHTAKMVSAETPAYTVFIQITNLYAYGQQAYIQGNNTKAASRFAPFFAMSITGDGAGVADQKAMVCPNHLCQDSGALLNVYFDGVQSDAQQILSVSVESSNKIKAGNTYMGNFKVLNGLTQQDFRERGRQDRSYYWYGDGGVIQGKILVQGTNQLFCRVVCPLEIEDIRRIVCFTNNKNETAVTSNSPSLANFTGSRGYTTDYTTELFDKSTSNPLEQRVSANFVDIADQLCLWQYPYTDMSVNRFTEDDIPEYVPPGPEPGDDIHERHTGSTGGLYAGPIAAVSNFVTHWVLDAAQVQAFGSHLWTDLLDFDAQGEPTGTQLWKNAKIALGTYFQTGSFDPGSIMELLIGLRYFPINLANASYATQQNIPAVYFGTGRVGVDVTTNPWKLNQNAVYITGGDLDLSQLSWNKYDDWRDVYNVSASIYIPFCGTYELPWSDIYNGTLHLSYGIDILSGALTAFVECTLGLSRFLVCVGSGMVGFEVPITATSANRLNAAILGDMGNMMGTLFNPADAVKVATALAGGGSEGSTGGAPVGDIEPTATNAAGSAPIVGQIALAGRVAEIHTGIASRPGITCPAMPGGRGWGALTGQRVPFITIRKGRYAGSAGYSKAEGNPRMETKSIGSVSGYTECINPDLSGIPCSKEEKEMIKQILETGFYA